MVPSKININVTNDPRERSIGAEIQAILERESRYRVELIERPHPNQTKSFGPPPDMIILVLSASTEQAIPLLATLRVTKPYLPVLLVVRPEDLSEMHDELSRWANDFLVTPIRAAEVCARVQRLLGHNGEGKPHQARQQGVEADSLERFVGEDPAFVAVKQLIPIVARSGTPVLVTGETGTGKELCARALHYLSPRAKEPFLPVNCAAIPLELFESELFGHKKGSFTGAFDTQQGLISEAEGGTLFLDEIDSLSLGAQVKLLRFLEDHTYYSLGSSRPRHADVRIIAASNRDLPQKIQERTFREDLFYRLAVMVLRLPPLRQRSGDIPLLIRHFWTRVSDNAERVRPNLSSRSIEALCRYSWPGNIRELQNVIQQLVVMTEADTIEPEHLPIPLPAAPKSFHGVSFKQAKAQIIEHFEKNYIADLLREHLGNVSRAAKEAGKERRALGRLIKKYQLQKH